MFAVVNTVSYILPLQATSYTFNLATKDYLFAFKGCLQLVVCFTAVSNK